MFAGVKLERPLYKLPIRFCVETLEREVRALPADAWVPHPQNFEGNDYVPLITPMGRITNDFAGPMAMTPYLQSCPYMMEAMAALDCVWGRSRLMGLGPGQGVPEHIDGNYYWRTHVRMHIPIVTNPDVAFTCGGQTVHMAAGECWVVDTFQSHEVKNDGSEQRIHIVLDTVGGAQLWDVLQASDREMESVFLRPGTIAAPRIKVEKLNYPLVMSPWEMRVHFDEMLAAADQVPALGAVRRILDRLVAAWTAAWAEYGEDAAGLPTYRALISAVQKDLNQTGGHAIMLANRRALFRVLQGFVFENAVESDRVREARAAALADPDDAQRLAS